MEEFVTDKVTVEVPEGEVQEEDMVEESQEPNYRQMNLVSTCGYFNTFCSHLF